MCPGYFQAVKMCGPGSFLTQEIQPLSVVGRDGYPFLVGFGFSASQASDTLFSSKEKVWPTFQKHPWLRETLSLFSHSKTNGLVAHMPASQSRACTVLPALGKALRANQPSWVTLWLSGKHSSQGCVLKCLCLKALGRAGELRCHAFHRKALVQPCRSLAASAVQHTKCCASRGQSSCAS